ncbi:disintegrin and metalloproteinase domain-containing protein 32 [Alligator mississippiensis]|uniref:Disintegrin and metalloproteinase domain-containing protein 32 n=1 Tax=Alligator mississippiensis TaxID=8496 RepID=A0A151MW55_ALLMI|nr:disintegrin and metalloproteinase domain-containing protein 32 [Alligator mississippiensis]
MRALLPLLLAARLGATLPGAPASAAQRTALHILVPWLLSSAPPGAPKISYVLTIEGKPYTVHLQQQVFLPSDFRVYTYSRQGAVHAEIPTIKRDCFYRGYVVGFPSSVVTLSTCTGLRGVLQVENVTYGIEPLDSAPGFQHLMYRVWNEDVESRLFVENDTLSGDGGVILQPDAGRDAIPIQGLSKSPRYVEMHVVVAKALYDYMGSDKEVVTEKVVQLLSFVNSVFAPLNVTIILSSLELWVDEDQMATAGEAPELLWRFLRWKSLHRPLRPHDLSYLLVSRERPEHVGASFAGQLCLRNYSGGVALYQRAVTLETFSVVVAQLLGLSLGMTLEDPRTCRCAGATCVMHPGAVGASGPRAFSACSIRDLVRFLASEDGRCLLNRPHMNVSYRAPVCGNNIVEPGEECDCGSSWECQRSRCCQPTCRFRSNIKCSTGLCCWECQFLRNGTLCRSTVDGECDLQEYCNGSSGACPPDFWVMDGHPCKRQSGYCYKSRCQLADKQCTQVFGRGAKSAPLACYEEVNSKNDRMGNCGSQPRGYLSCPASDFLCGKLVCELPLKKPFVKTTAAVIYARAKSHLCVTLDYMQELGKTDPMAVSDGTVCGDKKICINRKCVDVSVLGYNCDVAAKCNNRGVCNNRGNCHCESGWMPPDCTVKTKAGFGGSIDSNFRSSPITDGVHMTTVRNWLLLSCFLFLPVLVGSVILVMKRKKLAQCCDKEELQADNLEDVGKPGDPRA